MKHSSRLATQVEELPAGLAERADEELGVRRRLRLGFLVAVVLHFVLFSVNLPSAEEPHEPEPEKRPVLYLLNLPPMRPPEANRQPIVRASLPVPVPVPAPIPELLEPQEFEPPAWAPEVDAVLDPELIITPLPPAPVADFTQPIVVGGEIAMPRKLHHVSPDYPRSARQVHWQGVVILQVILDRRGAVRSVEVLRPQPFGLTEAAMDAVRQWRYEPVLMQGIPVEALMTVTVQFLIQ